MPHLPLMPFICVYRHVYFYAFACYLSMVMAGVTMVWPSPLTAWYNSNASEVPMNQDEVSWMVSVGPIGAGISSIPSGVLADRFGRKTILLVTGVLSGGCWLLIAMTRNKWSLYIAQVLGGAVVGGLVCVAPIYLSEISPPKIRGALVGQLSTMSFVGQLVVYALGPHLTYHYYVWVCASIPLLFLLTFIFTPESPYYLMSKGQKEEAKRAMFILQGEELCEAESTFQELLSSDCTLSELTTWDALKQNRFITHLFFLVVLSGVSQMNGNATVSVYGEEFIGGRWVILAMGVLFVLTSFFASFLTDPFGRRPLLIFSLIGSAVSTSLLAAYFLANHKITLLYFGLFGFCIISSLGVNPIILTLPSELFPTRLRALASGLSQLITSVAAFVTLKMFVPVNTLWGIHMNFIVYSVVSLIGAVAAILLPETAKTTISSC